MAAQHYPHLNAALSLTLLELSVDMAPSGVCRHGSVLGMSQVWSGLWVGSAHTVNAQQLSARGITTLVWAAPEVQLPQLPCEGLKIHKVMVRDRPQEDLQLYFPLVAGAFRECQESGEGLAVVCRVGKSRSAALALAALLSLPKAGLTLKEAYLTVKAARPIIRPNPGFFAQLISYEEAVRGQASVTMERSPCGEVLLPTVYIEEMSGAAQGTTFTTFLPL